MGEEQTPKEQLQKMREGVERLRVNSEQWIEVLGIQAKQIKAFYDALVREGFSQSDALEIVKVRGAS